MIVRLLLVLGLLALLAQPAAAQTTTTTTLAAGSAWTCTRDFTSVLPMFYIAIGRCTATGAYTQSGGDPLGSAATAAATALALCGSGNQTLVDLLTVPDGNGITPAVCSFNMTSLKYVCTTQATASASSPMVETTISSVVMAPFRYVAFCK